MEKTRFRLLRFESVTDDIWSQFHALRDARPRYDDPFFDPDYARLVARVRPDARLGLAFEGDELVGAWPIHRRPGAWARPIGGPFSDWHGPVLSADTDLTAHAFLRGIGVHGMSSFGWLPQDTESEGRLSIAGANMSDVSSGWDSFMGNQGERWPKHFKKMRRLARNMERDFSEVEFRFDDESDDTYDSLGRVEAVRLIRITPYHEYDVRFEDGSMETTFSEDDIKRPDAAIVVDDSDDSGGDNPTESPPAVEDGANDEAEHKDDEENLAMGLALSLSLAPASSE